MQNLRCLARPRAAVAELTALEPGHVGGLSPLDITDDDDDDCGCLLVEGWGVWHFRVTSNIM